MKINIPEDHPRAVSLRTREQLIKGFEGGAVASAGLIAHGRGEAFDYLFGEITPPPTLDAIKVAAASLLIAEHPVISVNGNTAALAANEIVALAEVVGAKLEVNLFYRTLAREETIRDMLKRAGAKNVLGVGGEASARLQEIGSERRRVDPEGILIADVVLVPLEDGDRTEALINMGKTVLAIDLNPLSRTAQKASITIVDNLIRCIPLLKNAAETLQGKNQEKLIEVVKGFDNRDNLRKCLEVIRKWIDRSISEVEPSNF